jgi:hypothetical protein
MKKGYSFDSFGAEVGVSRDCLYDWVKRFPEFAEAKKMAELEGLKFWETLNVMGASGQKTRSNGKIDGRQVQFTLQSRFRQQYPAVNKIIHEGSEEHPVVFQNKPDLKKLSDEELEKYLDLVKKLKSEESA